MNGDYYFWESAHGTKTYRPTPAYLARLDQEHPRKSREEMIRLGWIKESGRKLGPEKKKPAP